MSLVPFKCYIMQGGLFPGKTVTTVYCSMLLAFEGVGVNVPEKTRYVTLEWLIAQCSQFTHIVSSACQKLGFLQQNLKPCAHDVKPLAYYAPVPPDYSIPVSHPYQVGEIDRESCATPRDKCHSALAPVPVVFPC